MEPDIRYAQTSDGATIAYSTVGAGPALVWLDLPYSHVHEEWSDPNTRSSYETNASVCTFVRFDHRGFGLSDRGIHDFSLDAMVRDLEAVVDRLELPRFSLCAWRGITTPIAIAYAARHPERLTRLVLAQGAARMAPPTRDSVGALLKLLPDWNFVTESISRLVQGWDDDASSRPLAALLRAAVDPNTFAAFWAAASEWDASDLLPSIPTRTLLLHWKGHPLFGEENARLLAARLPNARSAIIDGATVNDRTEQYQRVFGSFFNTQNNVSGNAFKPPEAQTAIIMFADIVDSTTLTERLGDAAFRDKARALDDALRAIVRANGGAAIDGKLLGDGILATFASASQALGAALALAEAAARVGLQLHTGLHAGDVIREGDNVYGGAVNIAARVASASAPDEVLVSETVRGLARTSAGVIFTDRGEHTLKGIDEPHRLYAAERG